ncbi:hypothetical protein SUBVAR_04105 [Subdoligranulum variabile DSM 15176]|uniref:Uncharacterized protein n=1 Tax=Subdoligranulum variabile DSM 15176 TaxID=411471 RepID=D1PIE0_9FIRM|nr:hypothetical protein SUBVAR_04105 [Subdoligranulum variabile DSM 15176]
MHRDKKQTPQKRAQLFTTTDRIAEDEMVYFKNGNLYSRLLQ